MLETIGQVRGNEELAPDYRILTLSFDRDIPARSGQFAMLRARRAFEPLLRRALAIYKQDGPRSLSFLYQVLGRGTQTLAALAVGDEIEILLPLGNSWLNDGRPIPQDTIIVAGGIGSASVLMLAEELIEHGRRPTVLIGASSGSAMQGCGIDDFKQLDLPLHLCTDDGSLGEKGFVTAPLERLLAQAGSRPTVYACGPWAMMQRTAEICASFQVDCVVSLEAPMGCGFGVCVGCVVAVNTDGPLGYDSYKRVCMDGSIFPASQIKWEVPGMTH